MIEKKMTKTDEANINNCPDKKWFGVVDVFPRIKRGRFSLDRLVDFGKLESEYTKGEMMYRKLTN